METSISLLEGAEFTKCAVHRSRVFIIVVRCATYSRKAGMISGRVQIGLAVANAGNAGALGKLCISVCARLECRDGVDWWRLRTVGACLRGFGVS